MKTPEKIKRDMIECMEEANWVVEVGDAHDLIDSVEKAHETMADALSFIRRLEQDNAQKDERIRQLEQRVPRWISVEERLPDKSHDWVLIIGKWESDGGWIVPHVAEYREGIWMTNGTGWNKIEDLHIKITHWMPLPQPPEEDANES